MSEEYNNYINEMKSVFNKTLEKIKDDFNANKYNNELMYMSQNNEGIKKYVIHLVDGSGLSNAEENKKAFYEINETHINFMREYYKIIGWDVIH